MERKWNEYPTKRKMIFHYLSKTKADLVCLQERHIKLKDVKYLKNNKLGNEYLSATTKAKRGVVIYVNQRIKSRKIFSDSDGHYVAVEVINQEEKINSGSICTPK